MNGDKKILRVGGILKISNLNSDYALFSDEGIVKSLTFKWYHQYAGHDERGYTFIR